MTLTTKYAIGDIVWITKSHQKRWLCKDPRCRFEHWDYYHKVHRMAVSGIEKRIGHFSRGWYQPERYALIQVNKDGHSRRRGKDEERYLVDVYSTGGEAGKVCLEKNKAEEAKRAKRKKEGK